MTFNHIAFGLITLLAVAELVKEILIVQILEVLMIFLVGLKVAPLEHPAVAAITSKVKALSQLEVLMVFVALKDTPNTYAMRL